MCTIFYSLPVFVITVESVVPELRLWVKFLELNKIDSFSQDSDCFARLEIIIAQS